MVIRLRTTGLDAPGKQLPGCTIFPFLFSRRPAMLLLGIERPQGASLMEWVTPQHEEIDLNCEISSYANAEL